MAKGGNRSGAGRPGWRRKAESCLRIDVRDLARRKLLGSGWTSWGWKNAYTGETSSSVHLGFSQDRMSLNYSQDGLPKAQNIFIEHTPCPFGGSRPWFLCGGCHRRVAILFFGGAGFTCRKCARVAYSSQSEDSVGRAWRRQRKLESRLGEYWARPQGMRLTTYSRILGNIHDCEDRREASLHDFMAKHGMLGEL